MLAQAIYFVLLCLGVAVFVADSAPPDLAKVPGNTFGQGNDQAWNGARSAEGAWV
jgi:hypothetical protein